MKPEARAPALALSRAAGCLLAAVATFLSHLWVHLWLYGRDPERFAPLRFFAAPAVVAVVAIVLAAAWVTFELLRNRRGDGGVPLQARTMLRAAILAAAVLGVVATFSFLEFDPYQYWAVVAIVVGFPAVGSGVAISVLLVLAVAAWGQASWRKTRPDVNALEDGVESPAAMERGSGRRGRLGYSE